MKTSDLIVKIALETGLSQADVKAVVDATFKTITETTAAGETVNIHGVGKFLTSHRSARNGVNPKTRQPISVPAKDVLVFRASPALNK